MITFKQFVAEGADAVAEMHELIRRDCQPWLKAAGGLNAFRGMKIDAGFMKPIIDDSNRFILATTRKDRKPADSPQWLHDTMNEHFIEKIGIPLRSQSVFAGTIDTAFTYYNRETNNVYSVYPIGEFQYAWSDIIYDPTMIFYSNITHQLFSRKTEISRIFKKYWNNNYEQYELPDFDTYVSGTPALNKTNTKLIAMITDFIKFNNFWKYNTGLREVLTEKKSGGTSSSELMIVCDKYYAVQFRYSLMEY